MSKRDGTVRKGFTCVGAILMALGFALFVVTAQAADLQVVEGSSIAGISFKDRPVSLPIQRNFQMAMLTASSELGRRCGPMEAYGWRMAQNEQQRVNQSFNDTINQLRAQGYAIESKTSGNVSQDVTIFTADRQDKRLLFMWSAGDIGVAMVLCETSTPLNLRTDPLREGNAPSVSTKAFADMGNELRNIAPAPASMGKTTGKMAEKFVETAFTPVGEWTGSYACSQGSTGGTLRITKVNNHAFEGQFLFFGTPQNPNTPKGRYMVSGEYDSESQRILINPGKWIERPEGYDNTIMIGSFNPATKLFSGYFQGVSGCTSFEASYSPLKGVSGKGSGQKKLKSPAKTVAAKTPSAPKTEGVSPALGETPAKEGVVKDVAAPAQPPVGVVNPSPELPSSENNPAATSQSFSPTATPPSPPPPPVAPPSPPVPPPSQDRLGP